jgi:ribulose-5-phosphate 4-epimerase/fuculose-1-phosphate aldolase
VIHSAIHRARHDVDCVIHTHTAAGMAVSQLECGLLPLNQTAMRFAHCAYHDYEGVVLDLDEQARLVADLGEADLMILRNHGLLVVATSIPQAFNHIHRAELSCRTQLMAMAAGAAMTTVPTQVVEATFQAYQPNVRRPFGVLDWPALLRKLDRLDPSYRS